MAFTTSGRPLAGEFTFTKKTQERLVKPLPSSKNTLFGNTTRAKVTPVCSIRQAEVPPQALKGSKARPSKKPQTALSGSESESSPGSILSSAPSKPEARIKLPSNNLTMPSSSRKKRTSTYTTASSTSTNEAALSTKGTTPASSSPRTPITEDSHELSLLDDIHLSGDFSHEEVTAPIFTRDAFDHGDGLKKAIRQYGVLGSIISIHNNKTRETFQDRRLNLNTNAPFSAVICGVQGSGKSHSTSVMLEAMLIPDRRIGNLSKPLAGLVLHFGEGGDAASPCEAAFLCRSSEKQVEVPKVAVYVSPSQLGTMQRLYEAKFGRIVTVLPFKIAHSEVDSKTILALMCVSKIAEPPLYVQIILNVLRDLGEAFTYTAFKERMKEGLKTFNPDQLRGYQQRIALLESILDQATPAARFAPGQLTIVDLTDPFIDAASACSLFEIATRLFIRADVENGKVMVVDEAHKYLTRERGAQPLTQTLLSITRQQRHLGMRLILSTQEPTVIPQQLLDLCSVTIMHRFSSIAWFDHLSKHVSSEFPEEAFDTVVKLQTGQAMVLAPSGYGLFEEASPQTGVKVVGPVGRRYFVMKTRRRVTTDGGASILAIA